MNLGNDSNGFHEIRYAGGFGVDRLSYLGLFFRKFPKHRANFIHILPKLLPFSRRRVKRQDDDDEC